MMYMDQTRNFPVVLNQGNGYIMVLYKTDANLVLIKLMKTRSSSKMCWAYNKVMMCLTNWGIKVAKHILNNKASDNYLQAIKQNGIEYEKIPPNIHQRNMAEKAISMFKDHFQAIMAGVNDTFPMHL